MPLTHAPDSYIIQTPKNNSKLPLHSAHSALYSRTPGSRFDVYFDTPGFVGDAYSDTPGRELSQKVEAGMWYMSVRHTTLRAWIHLSMHGFVQHPSKLLCQGAILHTPSILLRTTSNCAEV